MKDKGNKMKNILRVQEPLMSYLNLVVPNGHMSEYKLLEMFTRETTQLRQGKMHPMSWVYEIEMLYYKKLLCVCAH